MSRTFISTLPTCLHHLKHSWTFPNWLVSILHPHQQYQSPQVESILVPTLLNFLTMLMIITFPTSLLTCGSSHNGTIPYGMFLALVNGTHAWIRCGGRHFINAWTLIFLFWNSTVKIPSLRAIVKLEVDLEEAMVDTACGSPTPDFIRDAFLAVDIKPVVAGPSKKQSQWVESPQGQFGMGIPNKGSSPPP